MSTPAKTATPNNIKQQKLCVRQNNGYYTNGHLAELSCGVATEEQIHASIKGALDKASIAAERSFVRDYTLSLVKNKEGKSFGYAYIWFFNIETFNVIVGKNPNGTPRIEFYDDPNWEPKQIDYSDLASLANRKWADIDDEDECPRLSRELPHLAPMDDYEPTDEQIYEYRNLPKDDNLVRLGMFKIKPATVGDDGKYVEDVLICSNIPTVFNETDIHKFFRPYVTTPEKTVTQKINGKDVQLKYPLVQFVFKDKVSAIVRFDPATKDSRFVSKVTRVVKLTKNEKEHTLIFMQQLKAQPGAPQRKFYK